MAGVNCWESRKCGREPGGPKAAELGVCAAALTKSVDGMNGGKNGGRSCWAIAGTLCGGIVQGTYAAKMANCMACAFYQSVVAEEGRKLATPREILARMQSAA